MSESGNFHMVPNCPAAVKANYTAGPKGTEVTSQEMNTVPLYPDIIYGTHPNAHLSTNSEQTPN